MATIENLYTRLSEVISLNDYSENRFDLILFGLSQDEG
jgi:hypothetical protein